MIRALVVTILVACGGTPSHAPLVNQPQTPAGPAPYVVAVVMAGWEVWIGNDHNPRVPADDPTRYAGALERIAAVFDKSGLAKSAPPGSQAMIVTFADDVKVRMPLAPIANLTGAAFGTQVDYYGSTGNELVRGIERAADELDKIPAGKHFLIVLCDGNDTNDDEATKQMPKLKQRLARANVTVIAVGYHGPLSLDFDLMKLLTPSSTRATSLDAFEADLTHALTTVR